MLRDQLKHIPDKTRNGAFRKKNKYTPVMKGQIYMDRLHRSYNTVPK